MFLHVLQSFRGLYFASLRIYSGTHGCYFSISQILMVFGLIVQQVGSAECRRKQGTISMLLRTVLMNSWNRFLKLKVLSRVMVSVAGCCVQFYLRLLCRICVSFCRNTIYVLYSAILHGSTIGKFGRY